MFDLSKMMGGPGLLKLASILKTAKLAEVPEAGKRAALVGLGELALAPGASLLSLSSVIDGKPVRAVLVVTE